MIRFEWLQSKIKTSNRTIFSDYEARLKKTSLTSELYQRLICNNQYVTFHVAKNKEVAIKFVCVKILGNSHSGTVKGT